MRDVPDLTYFQMELDDALVPFNNIKSKILEKLCVVKKGDTLQIDDIDIEFLYSYRDGLFNERRVVGF